MGTALFVVSDLHLGGEPGPDGSPGFQICPAPNQAVFSAFVERLPSPSRDNDVRLVIAGDIVDFLTETEFDAFTLDEVQAKEKLGRILDRTAIVWQAISKFLARGGALTLMLGNHDVELCLPGVRGMFLNAIGGGRVEFLYDNEAFSCGPVLVEHGNRFDEWNAIRYGALRRVRSQLSRRISADPFPAPPGSELVAEVMNRLKGDYSFIDLLKPEDAGVLPILAALGAGSLRDYWQLYQKHRLTREVEFDENRQPLDETYIASAHQEEQQMFNLAEDIAAGGDATQVSAISEKLLGARSKVSESVREYRRRSLLTAFRAFANHHKFTFDISRENDRYVNAAQMSVSKGFKVIVYGHTHLVKRVSLANGEDGPVYLNSGTWADLMRVPESIWGEYGAAEDALKTFVTDLESDNVKHWRRAVPTFARIELNEDEVKSADVYFADGRQPERVTQDGLVRRLAAEAYHA
jgi:UDP-2,3-diacylglucosamine pyrophosphatase LpxH